MNVYEAMLEMMRGENQSTWRKNCSTATLGAWIVKTVYWLGYRMNVLGFFPRQQEIYLFSKNSQTGSGAHLG
jgi:hypothetical protein